MALMIDPVLGCPWLSSQWVTGFALFSNLLKMFVLGSPECVWLCFVLKLAENGCPWLFRRWVTGLALLLSLLRMIALASPVGEWLGLFSSLLKMVVLGASGCGWLGSLCFQACWKWLSLALQEVSEWACYVFKLAKTGCPWLFSLWVTEPACFQACWEGCLWLSRL